MMRRGVVPNLVIAQRVVDKMVAAAQHFIEDETGEAMVGLVAPGPSDDGIPTIYILDTISPDDSAVRQMHTFQQGDERQDEMIWWLQENWHAQRDKRRGLFAKIRQDKWDVPLRYLGDWHKQPGYMIAPSGGDLMTALDWLDDPENGMDYLLAPIVTLGHPGTTDGTNANVNYLTVPTGGGEAMRVDFWYIHHEVRMFQPINPVVYPDDQLPELTPYPWHLTHTERIKAELERFDDNNIAYSILLSDTDNKMPLEVCITAAQMGGNQIYLIATPWNYPEAAPEVRLTAFVSMDADETVADVFDEWWARAKPALPPEGWVWSEEKYLIDFINALEGKNTRNAGDHNIQNTTETEEEEEA